MVTLKQVAAEAGVSMSTASAALRGMSIVKPDTTKKVLDAAERLNYRTNISARALRSGQSNLYTLIVPDLENQFYSKLANSLSRVLLNQGKQLIIQVSLYNKESELQQIQQINPSTCDGLFICSMRNSGREINQITGDTYPVVMFDDLSAPIDVVFDSVETPSLAGTHAAIRHLVEDCQRTRIGIVGALADTADHSLSVSLRQQRYVFAQRTLHTCGLTTSRDSLIPSDWSFDAGVKTAHQLAAGGTLPFDALYCMNDELALGIMHGLVECGVSIPDEVAIMGFDGILAGSLTTPTLTTIAVDFDSMANTAAQMMQEHIEWRKIKKNRPTPRRIIVGFQLCKRESTMGHSA